jgi:predicted phosphoribosyltransferase
MSLIISEPEFRKALYEVLQPLRGRFKCVTGPGRSGAVASVYASHFLKIPWVPCRSVRSAKLHPVLVVDTAVMTGATLRKASRRVEAPCSVVAVYMEPPIIRFWYEVY